MLAKKYYLKIAKYIYDPLLKNSIYIIFTSSLNSFFGFLFWIVAAKLYLKTEVGLATAIISSLTLLVLLSKGGMDYSIIRFFPNNDKSKVLSTYLIISCTISCVLGVIYIYYINLFSSELSFIKCSSNTILFLLFLITNTSIMLIWTSFIAVRRAGYNFIQTLFMGLRIIFLLPFLSFGAMGIFSAVGFSLFLTLLISYLLLIKVGIKLKLSVDRSVLLEGFRFSATNHVSSLLISVPNMILPIMVLNITGAEQTAFYYISFTLASILYLIPSSISTSLFVEGSHGESLKKAVIKSAIFTLCILTPCSIILYVWGDLILKIINAEYAIQGFKLLKLMVIAGFFISINQIYFSIKRVQKDNKLLLSVTALNSILLILLAYAFLISFGIIGVGYAWIGSYAISSIFIIILIWKKESWFN